MARKKIFKQPYLGVETSDEEMQCLLGYFFIGGTTRRLCVRAFFAINFEPKHQLSKLLKF